MQTSFPNVEESAMKEFSAGVATTTKKWTWCCGISCGSLIQSGLNIWARERESLCWAHSAGFPELASQGVQKGSQIRWACGPWDDAWQTTRDLGLPSWKRTKIFLPIVIGNWLASFDSSLFSFTLISSCALVAPRVNHECLAVAFPLR